MIFALINLSIPSILPSWIVVPLPLLATAIIAYLQTPDPQHPNAKVLNAIISIGFFLIAGAICLILAGPLSGDFGFDATVYLTFVGLIMLSPPCKQLYGAIVVALPSPITPLFQYLEQLWIDRNAGKPIQLQAVNVSVNPSNNGLQVVNASTSDNGTVITPSLTPQPLSDVPPTKLPPSA